MCSLKKMCTFSSHQDTETCFVAKNNPPKYIAKTMAHTYKMRLLLSKLPKQAKCIIAFQNKIEKIVILSSLLKEMLKFSNYAPYYYISYKNNS